MKHANDNINKDVCYVEEVFIHTVLGLPFHASCIMQDGHLVWHAKPLPRHVEPNLMLIAEALRNPHTLHPKILSWIADLFDKNREGDFKVTELAKNGRGARKSGGDSANWYLADEFNQLIEEGTIRKAAIANLIEKYKVSERTIESAIASYAKALKEHDRVNEENY